MSTSHSSATTGGVPPVRFDNLFVCVTQLIIHLDRALHYLLDSVRKPSTLVAGPGRSRAIRSRDTPALWLRMTYVC